MTTAVGDNALQFCAANHLVPPGTGAHELPANIAAIRTAARRRYYTPADPQSVATAADAEADAVAPVAPVASPAPAQKGKGGKGGKGAPGGKGKRPFRQR